MLPIKLQIVQFWVHLDQGVVVDLKVASFCTCLMFLTQCLLAKPDHSDDGNDLRHLLAMGSDIKMLVALS